MLTVLEIIKRTTDFFEGKGVQPARLNAEHLIGHALGLKRMALYLQFERLLTEPELERIRPLVRRRAQREPLQYIVGETEWGELRLKVDRRALIPRPETEYLLELLSQRIEAPQRILDLGTGSGAIALALAKRYSQAEVLAIDQSEDALTLARENAALNELGRVQFRRSDWFGDVPTESPFDLIVANPPYLTEGEWNEAEAEVRDFEPKSALIAPDEGLADLLKITRAAAPFLAKDGLLAVETGIAHHVALKEQTSAQGWTQYESQPDLTGRDRFVFLRR